MIQSNHPLQNKRISGILRAFAGLLVFTALTGCLTAPENEVDASPRLRMNLSLERPASTTQKLKSLHVTLQSDRGDTLRDTITDFGGTLSGATVILNPHQSQGQVLTPRYNLPTSGRWTCLIESFDLNDSLIHNQICDAGTLEAGDIRDLPIKLTSRIAAYEGLFIPRSTTPDGRTVHVERYELDVDGRTLCAARFIESAANTPVKLACDYMPTGSHQVAARIYGTIGNSSESRLLWSGHTQIEISAGTGTTVPVELAWNQEAGTLGKTSALANTVEMNTEFRLGRVGQVVMNVVVSAAVVL